MFLDMEYIYMGVYNQIRLTLYQTGLGGWSKIVRIMALKEKSMLELRTRITKPNTLKDVDPDDYKGFQKPVKLPNQ